MSNKTLLILIVAVTVVTIVSTWFIVDTVFNMDIADETDGTGHVSITIDEPEDEFTIDENFEETDTTDSEEVETEEDSGGELDEVEEESGVELEE